GSQDAVGGGDGVRAGARALHLDEATADDLRGQRAQLHPGEMGQDVNAERGPVAVDGLGLAPGQREDVVEPVGRPPAEGRVLARVDVLASVALRLESPLRLDDLPAGLAPQVLAVGTAV